jgi:hypothetical protein
MWPPIPPNWDITADCETFRLYLPLEKCNGTDDGRLSLGTATEPPASFGGAQIFGFWSDQAQKLTFLKMQPGDPNTVQVFTGYLMSPTPGAPCALAGSFEALGPTAYVTQTVGTCQRCVFGWYALPGT